MYKDETGHSVVAALGALFVLGTIGAITSFASQSLVDLATGQGFDWGRSGIAAGAGFIGGMTLAIPVGGAYISAALTSGLNTIGQMAYSGNDYSIGDYFLNVAISVGISAASSFFVKSLFNPSSFIGLTDFVTSSYFSIVSGIGGAALITGIDAIVFSLQLIGRVTISNLIAFIFTLPLNLGNEKLVKEIERSCFLMKYEK